MDIQKKSDSLVHIKELVDHICVGLPKDACKKIGLQAVTKFVKPASQEIPYTDQFENRLCQKIEAQLDLLSKENRDILEFHRLFTVLKHNENTSNLKYRCSLMTFFLALSELNNNTKSDVGSDQFDIKNIITKNLVSKDDLKINRPVPRSSFSEFSNTKSIQRPANIFSNFKSRVDYTQRIEKSPSLFSLPSHHNQGIKHTSSLSVIPRGSHISKPCKFTLPERKVVDHLLACFQGIASPTFKLDHQQGFTISPEVNVPKSGLVLKLMELGYLHNLIVNQYKLFAKQGAVAQSVLGSVKKMISEYYRSIASIHSEHMSSERRIDDTPMSDIDDTATVTIRRLVYLMHDNFIKLKVLADVTRVSLEGRGGVILSYLDVLRHNGNPMVADPISNITAAAGVPLINMIITWMVEGELQDPFDEFFITENSSCHERDIWRDKFILRPNLIPSMINPCQAQHILNSGKAINFLNVICKKRVRIEGHRARLDLMRKSNIIDFSNLRSQIYNMIVRVDEENSKQVLETVKNQFKLFLHFRGLRRYILLGQGDFVNYFMELVEPEMKQRASDVRYHDLSEKLHTAIKSTTAIYEDPDIIKNVSVKLLVASGGDWGADIFGLQYQMDEHLSTAFRLNEGAYSHLFNFLWRTKSMEHRLLLLRENRWAMKNSLNWLSERFKDINGVLMLADKLSQEFLHFARQFHYYILFEVVECLWQKFCNNYEKAKSFDDVIQLHDDFIREMQHKTFQTKSKSFINELRLIWDLALELETLEDKFFNRINIECELWKERENDVEKFGTSFNKDEEYNTKTKEFKTFLSSLRAQYSIIIRNYQEVLRRFLLDLSLQKDHELRLLSERIDYNEHYKNIDARISDSRKYSRCSDIFP